MTSRPAQSACVDVGSSLRVIWEQFIQALVLRPSGPIDV